MVGLFYRHFAMESVSDPLVSTLYQHHSLPDNIHQVALTLLYCFTASEHIVLTLMYTYCLTYWSYNDCSDGEDELCVTCNGISCGMLVRLQGVQSKS